MTAWPFWAPTGDDTIAAALALAGLRPGERLVDLGCGDGRVLERAALDFGAEVEGIELDPALAGAARDRLARAGVHGKVTLGDAGGVPLTGQVFYAFLSPATLQRLAPRLAGLAPGTRVVTCGFPVTGWEAAAAASGCWLYRLPAAPEGTGRRAPGWESAGLLVAVRPGAPALVAATLHHPGGPVEVRVTGGLAPVARAMAGADRARAGEAVAVDLVVEAGEGALPAGGLLEAGPAASLAVFVAGDPGPPGRWGLSEEGVGLAARAMAGGGLGRLVAGARGAPTGG